MTRRGGNDEIRMTNAGKAVSGRLRHSSFVIDSSFDIRASSFRAGGAFTILEVLVVMTIIIVLAGLILVTSGYVQKKGARSRAEAEIAAMSAALENYKADNGTYPITPITSALDARIATNPATYQTAAFDVYAALTGDTNGDRTLGGGDADPSAKSYISFSPNQLNPPPPSTVRVTSIRDPFGNSYGYSTAYQHDVEQGNPPTHGYNPTFDLWSTANSTDPNQWIKNW